MLNPSVFENLIQEEMTVAGEVSDEGPGIGGKLSGLFRHNKVRVSASFENVFYAYKIDPSSNEKLPEHLFTYFVLMSKIGVWDYGNGVINDIHFRLTFKPLIQSLPNVEIIKVAPTDERREVGTVSIVNKEQSSKGGTLAGNVGLDVDVSLLKTNLELSGHIRRKSELEVLEKSVYPKEILITRSSGVGNDAIWEFRQGGAAGWTGSIT